MTKLSENSGIQTRFPLKLDTQLHLQVCLAVSRYQIVAGTYCLTVLIDRLPELDEKQKGFVQIATQEGGTTETCAIERGRIEGVQQAPLGSINARIIVIRVEISPLQGKRQRKTGKSIGTRLRALITLLPFKAILLYILLTEMVVSIVVRNTKFPGA